MGTMKLVLCAWMGVATISPVAVRAQNARREVPLRLEDGHLIVPVTTPAGQVLSFMLSTGTGTTVMSESGVRRMGDHGELTLGGLSVPTDNHATVGDDRLTIGSTVLDGIIGSNMISQYDVLIDVPAGTLILQTPGRSVAWGGVELSEPVQLRVYHGVVLSLDVNLAGHPYNAAFDLGLDVVTVNQGVQRGVDLDSDDTATLTIGTTSFPDIAVRVRDNDVLRRWDPDGEGFVMVGASITRDCVISLSFVHRELRTCAR